MALFEGYHHAESTAVQYRFNMDILWLILRTVVTPEQGTNIPDRHAFMTVLSASQVCRDWRQFIVGLPSIWCSVIDFTALGLRTPSLGIEVLKRIGTTCPLFVYGEAFLNDRLYTRNIPFIELLVYHWSRIRIFSVEIQDETVWECYILGVFWQRPAPLLEAFDLRFKGQFNSLGLYEGCTLFANDAPSIQNFYCPVFKFDYRAEWTKQLRNFEIKVSNWLDLLERIRTLENLPHLESLLVAGPSKTNIEETLFPSLLSEINCPQLSFISLQGAFVPLASLLCKIHPSPECRLNFTTSNRRSIMMYLNQSHFISSLIGEGYLWSPKMNELHVKICPDIFLFSGRPSTVTDAVVTTGTPHIEIRSEKRKFTSDEHSTLFGPILLSCNLICVTKLRLEVLEYYWVADAELVGALTTLFYSLPSLTELSVDYDGLRLLKHIHRASVTKSGSTTQKIGRTNIIFNILPSLTRINISSNYGRKKEFQSAEARQMLFDFLRLRNHRAVNKEEETFSFQSFAPIKFLDVSEYASRDETIISYKAVFEQIPGLQVVCKENSQEDVISVDNSMHIAPSSGAKIDRTHGRAENVALVQTTNFHPREWSFEESKHTNMTSHEQVETTIPLRIETREIAATNGEEIVVGTGKTKARSSKGWVTKKLWSRFKP